MVYVTKTLYHKIIHHTYVYGDENKKLEVFVFFLPSSPIKKVYYLISGMNDRLILLPAATSADSTRQQLYIVPECME